MSVPTPAESLAREKYMSFRRGWMHGASFQFMDSNFTEHKTRPDLKIEYENGYICGRQAYRSAMAATEERTGYKESIVRAL